MKDENLSKRTRDVFRGLFWTLWNKTPVQTDNPREFIRAFQDRRVALTKIEFPGNEILWVSTVFLGVDLNHFGVGPPILFESMIFGGPMDQEMNRYCTWDEAEKGHLEMVNAVVSKMKLINCWSGKIKITEEKEMP